MFGRTLRKVEGLFGEIRQHNSLNGRESGHPKGRY